MLSDQIRKLLQNKNSVKNINSPSPIVSNKSRGLGDTVEKIATNTGLNKITEAYTRVTKKDCGCNKRKEALNNLFPYKSE